jgi:NhaP-type Na+/H+ or K+/H+ antiporter
MDSDAIPAGYALAGIALLCAAVLPRVLTRLPLSPAIIFVAVGLLASFVPGAPGLDLTAEPTVVEHLTEVCVVVALMGVGLAIDRPLSWRGWGTTWRLLGIGMPLFIAAGAVAAWGLLGVGVAVAVLLASALAPTDPVLASDVQVGEPTDDPENEDEVRFSLSSEAGLNDGLAFPFVHAAILLTAGALGWGWVAWELLGKVVLGVAIGWTIGQVLGRLAFRAPTPVLRFADSAEAIVALSAVFVAYGAAELAGGYGFLAVFCAALAIRACERGHEYHRVLHEFIGQIERLLTLALLLGLGYAVGSGLLAALTPLAAAWAIGAVLILRPVTAWLSLRRAPVAPVEQRTIAFFGVRGIGTFYYVAYALSHASFPDPALIWATAACAVLASVVVHGVTASPVLRTLDRRFGRPTPDPV